MLAAKAVITNGAGHPRVEREDHQAEVPIVHLIASRLIDRSDLLDPPAPPW